MRKPNKTKLAGVNSRFASVSESEILKIQEDAVPENTKKTSKFGMKVFRGKLGILQRSSDVRAVSGHVLSNNRVCQSEQTSSRSSPGIGTSEFRLFGSRIKCYSA